MENFLKKKRQKIYRFYCKNYTYALCNKFVIPEIIFRTKYEYLMKPEMFHFFDGRKIIEILTGNIQEK